MGTLGGAGEGGLSDLVPLAFAKSADGTIPGQEGLDQPSVESQLKDRMRESQGWGGAHNALFAGLPAGIPFVIGLVGKIAEQLTGIDVMHWVQMWLDNPVGEAIGGIVQDALSVIFQVSANLQALFQSINFLDPDFNPATALVDFATALFNLLNPAQFFSLFGSVLGRLASLGKLIIPVGALSQEVPNQFGDDGDFPDGSIPPSSGGWFVNLSFSTDEDPTGVGEITANGNVHQLVSGDNPSDRIQVGQGTVIDVQVQAMHQGATYTGTGQPVVLRLERFNGATQLSSIDLATYQPTTPNVGAPGNLISGKYKIPAGVTHVNVVIEVNQNATGGQWRFDKGKFFASADITMFSGVTQAIEMLDNKLDQTLRGLASLAQGIPILDKLGVDDALRLFAQWNPAAAFNQVANMLRLAVGALLGRPVSSATAEDFANALAAANNIPGVDETTYITSAVTGTIPAFADFMDVVAVGKGQKGRNGGIIVVPVFGQGGAPGKLAAATWENSTHYTKGSTTYTVAFLSNGNALVTVGANELEAEAGSGPLNASPLGGWIGRGIEQVTYNDKPYTGGTNQNNWGKKGNSPGGGGGGGFAGLAGNEGGEGGDPAVWLRFRASSVVIADPSTGTDTTPPTDPTIFEVVSVTNNSIRVRVGGSSDA